MIQERALLTQKPRDSAGEQPVEISVVIPVYGAEATLESLLARLLPTLDELDRSYEVVFVEDGSPDNSWSKLQALQRRFPERIVAIQLMRNYGQHNALMCGFRHARGEFIVTMDDDLQNPPEEIGRLLAEMDSSDLDLVYGNYKVKKHHPFRNLGSRLVNGFYRFVFHTHVTVTSFRVIRRPLLECIFKYRRTFTFVDGLLAWNTQRIGAIQVDHNPRPYGRSGYSISKLVAMAINVFTNFSLVPLQVVSMLGILTALGGLGLGAFYLARTVFSDVLVPGYASTIVALLMLGGMQLLALGVIGEYLGRLHLNVNGKPQYCERQILDDMENFGATHENRRHAATIAGEKVVAELRTRERRGGGGALGTDDNRSAVG